MNKDWLDIGILEDYLDGKLDAKTMHKVEREALDDPFVAEALAGLSESPKRALQSISLLQKQLHERVAEHQAVKKTSVVTWQRLSIAATAAVMFIAVSIMFWMRENNRQKELAGRPKKVEVTIAARDSIKDNASVVAPAPVLAAAPTAKVKAKVLDSAIAAAKTNSYAARTKQEANTALAEAAPPEQLNAAAVVVAFGKQKRSEVVGAIAAKAPAQASPNVLSGKVTAQNDGNPLSGASIQLEGSNLVAVTDANGEFKINVDAAVKAGTIRTDYVGFEQKEAFAKINQPINIVMSPQNQTLNEMVVLGYGLAKSKQAEADAAERLNAALASKLAGVTTNQLLIRGADTVSKSAVMVADPVGGWDKLFAYIKANNSFAKTEKTGQVVELSFRIAKDGSPVDVKITKGADAKYEEEAIRLIINGPKWERPKKSRSRMTFQIDF